MRKAVRLAWALVLNGVFDENMIFGRRKDALAWVRPEDTFYRIARIEIRELPKPKRKRAPKREGVR